jgi:hypothetical protein
MKPPIPIAQPDFTELAKIVTGGVRQSIKDKYEDDDFQHYVYEAAMEAIYGPDYFKWRNSRRW